MKKRIQIPSTIFGAEFTLAIGCKLNCKYCPQGKLIRRYTELFKNDDLYMSFQNFKKCLSKIEKGCGIAITGMVEPFHNRECAKMIKYAYEQGYKITLATSLEGATEKDFEMLKDVKFSVLQLHIPDAEGNSRFSLSAQYFDVFKKFNKEFPVTGYSCHGHPHEGIKKYLNPEITVGNEMVDRAGNLDYSDLKHHNNTGKLLCSCGAIDSWSGWVPEILPNGAVSLCCMDYGLEHILGNILEQEWDEIFQGEEYLKFEQGMEDEKIPLLCRKCPAAEMKKPETFNKAKLLGYHAVKISRLLKNCEENGIQTINSEQAFSLPQLSIITKILAAEQICIFGLGKLFKDNYFNSLWYNVLPADLFSDNDKKKWNQTIRGISCVAPNELPGIKGLLVITYVNDDKEIRKSLNKIGITNIININEIFDLDF